MAIEAIILILDGYYCMINIKSNIMKKILFFLFIVLSISSCSSIKFNADYDGDVDFSQFKTLSYYGWQEESDKILNSLKKRELKKRLLTNLIKEAYQWLSAMAILSFLFLL
jgi:predicted transcriptional regulator with HTH domain